MTGVFVLLGAVSIIVAVAIATIGIETKGVLSKVSVLMQLPANNIDGK